MLLSSHAIRFKNHLMMSRRVCADSSRPRPRTEGPPAPFSLTNSSAPLALDSDRSKPSKSRWCPDLADVRRSGADALQHM